MTLALGTALDLMPKAEGWATAQWGALGTVVALEGAGFTQEAEETLSAVVISLQDEILRRRAYLDGQRAAGQRKRPPTYRDEPIVTVDNLRATEKIEAQEWLAQDARRRKDVAKAKEHFYRAADLRESTERDILGRQDDHWAQLALRESAGLEKERGEHVDVERVNGKISRLRIKSRDGLLAILPCHELNGEARRQSQILLKAGLEYRTVYEGSKAELGSSMPRGGGRAGGINPAAAAASKARMIEALRKMEDAVRGDQVNGRGIVALQKIAGEGWNLGQLARAGSQKALYSKALKRALSVIARESKIDSVRPQTYRA